MKFLLTMNMPAHRGGPIHQITCEHPAKSLAEFCTALEKSEFVLVEEFYRNTETPLGADPYYSVGFTALNYRVIGKVKELGTITTAHKGRIKNGDGYDQNFREIKP
ncbi:hypothetical protein UFOVP120_55 [uncultured Caudovirales phage]|uniref:Uncharacterized protein n=1 Tax=uncultured Caudovirales phage TaxID=2100421 RepID=A0A6J5LD21_9CAUD|nr:hypothetical protein UFOVP120_55 [uncultured Caudovirales phage]